MNDYKKVWTIIPVGARHGTILAPASGAGRRRYSSNYGSRSCVSAEVRELSDSYSLSVIPKQMTVVLGASDAERDEILRNMKNCLVWDWNGSNSDTQLHLWPLDYWPYFQQFYYGQDFKGMDLAGPEMWVDGARFDFEATCRACPNYLEQALDMCRPCTVKCTLGKPPFTLERDPLWFDAHPMNLSYLQEQKVFAYKPHGQLSIQPAFEKADFDTLSNDANEWNELHEERSRRSELAAATVRHRKNVCEGCLISRYSWCSYNGGQGCKGGPFVPEDYNDLAERCEPWMFWALDISVRDRIDMRQEIDRWRYTRINRQSVVGPTNRALDMNWDEYRKDMNVRVCRTGNRTLEFQTVPLQAVCEHLKLPVKTTWKEIYEEFDGKSLLARVGRPIPKHVLAATYLLYKDEVRSYRRPYCWGCTYMYLYEIELRGHALRFNFRTDHGASTSTSIDSLEDCFNLDNAGRSFAVISKERDRENRQLKKYVHQDRLPLTFAKWRALLQENPKWRRWPPRPEVLRRLLKQEAAAARKAAADQQAEKEKAERRRERAAQRRLLAQQRLAQLKEKQKEEAEAVRTAAV